jgi:Skp family chaperone for outer membrane proteins
VALCVFLGYQAAGTRNMAANPARVAVVQLKTVMDSIQQRAVIDMRLNQMEADVLEQDRVQRGAIEAVRTKIRTLVNDDTAQARQMATAQDPEYVKLTEELEVATLQYASWQRFTVDTIDLEKSLVVQELYRSVKQAIAALATAEGYDLVLIDDSQGELQINPEAQMSREAQLLQQVSLRKVLYASPVIDITDDVIVRMNNAFNAGNQP